MNISIIGTGNIGSALGKLIAQHTPHSLTVGSRDSKPIPGLQGRVTITSPSNAVHANEVIILATPFPALSEVVQTLGGADALAGKILVDVSNPLTPDMLGVTQTSKT